LSYGFVRLLRRTPWPKKITRESGFDPELLRIFVEEWARLMARLDHADEQKKLLLKQLKKRGPRKRVLVPRKKADED